MARQGSECTTRAEMVCFWMMQYPTGSLVGLIVRFSEKEVVELEDELFWYAVLPPILLVQVRWYVYGSTMPCMQ